MADGEREGFRPVCSCDAVVAGGPATVVQVADRRLAIFRVNGRIYAVNDVCPHAGGPLSQGIVTGTTVTCSWHCASFDLETGESLDSISRWNVETFPVRVRDGRIWIHVAGTGGGT